MKKGFFYLVEMTGMVEVWRDHQYIGSLRYRQSIRKRVSFSSQRERKRGFAVLDWVLKKQTGELWKSLLLFEKG